MTREEGGSPKTPIRKRAYYRAIKRGESWALMRAMRERWLKELNHTLYRFYAPQIKDEDLKINGLMSLLKDKKK